MPKQEPKARSVLNLKIAIVAAAAAGAMLAAPQIADACTRILWNNNKLAVVVGRTARDEPRRRAYRPAGGRPRQSGALDVQIRKPGHLDLRHRHRRRVERARPRRRHAVSAGDDFGPRDRNKPGLQAGLWAQYALDNAATVQEALDVLDKVQVVKVTTHGHEANVHLALEDSSGDSAIIEYIGGRPVVHHGRDYRVMTNDPTYDQQLALLQKQDFSKPSSDMPLPGNVNPRDRFQRAAYYMALLPEPKNEREAVAGVFAIARNVSVPFGAPYESFGIYNTEYRTVMNLTDKRYYFELTTSPNVIWADLMKMDMSAGAAVMVLHPDDITLSGDVTSKFKPAKAVF
jgi:choloylglycine hydrolase